jgi:septum formation protein
MSERLILASASPFRRKILDNAGITVDSVPASTDERAVEASLEGSGATPDDVALILAEAKALDVSAKRPEALVLGCDQTLALGDRIFHKPRSMEDARRHLLALSGKTHQLNSAAVLARNGETLWRHVGVASLTMRVLEPAFIGRYLAAVGDEALSSVGSYQVEGRGIQLFDQIEGDFFTIVGLPLLAVLAALRELGAVDG